MALPGLYKFFKKCSDEEREHALLFLEYMNKRGGQIIIEKIDAPKQCYATPKEALTDALKLELKVNEVTITYFTLGAV